MNFSEVRTIEHHQKYNTNLQKLNAIVKLRISKKLFYQTNDFVRTILFVYKLCVTARGRARRAESRG